MTTLERSGGDYAKDDDALDAKEEAIRWEDYVGDYGQIVVSSPVPFQGQGYNPDYGTVNVARLAQGIALAVAMQEEIAGLEPQGFELVDGDPEELAKWEDEGGNGRIRG